ncbi:hypothetical protein GCM10025762_00800 [Haloechinothrix salitolerans]
MPSNVAEQDVEGLGRVVGGWVRVGVGFGCACGIGVEDGDVRRFVVVVALVDGVVDVVVVGVGSAIDGPWNVAAVMAGSSAPVPRLLTSQNVAPSRAVAMVPMTSGFTRDGVGARCRPAMLNVILRGKSKRGTVLSRPITARARLDYE